MAVEPLTQTQLAEKMMLTELSMSHHLQLLRKAGLIRARSAKVGSHGILEKYYKPKAKLFLEDGKYTAKFETIARAIRNEHVSSK